MKKLIILRGVPFSGKTSLVKKLGLEQNTLNPDMLRIMMSGLELKGTGLEISQKDSFKVIQELFNILEQRMKYGLLTVIDNIMNIKEGFLDRFKVLCSKYAYECVVVDFNITLSECKKRNAASIKPLSETELEKYFVQKNASKIPSFCKVIKPESLEKEIAVKYVDLSKYKKINHIGDIHGCYSALKEGVKDIKFDEFYIFHGDYLDRGIENVKVLNFLLSQYKKPNVVFLKGNHELNLERYANGEEIFGLNFVETEKALSCANISQKELKAFCKKLKNVYTYNYKGHKVICTHGGIGKAESLNLISGYSFIVGSDEFNDDIDNIWAMNMKNSNIIQVHGHRNEKNLQINATKNSYNLDGGTLDAVEKGGHLRTLSLSEKGFCPNYIKNNVFNEKICKQEVVPEDL